MECDCRVVEEREEKSDPVFYRLLKAFMKGSHEGSQNAPRLKMVDADCIREATETRGEASRRTRQCVIVGRGSAYYLQTQARCVSRFCLRAARREGSPPASPGQERERGLAARRDRRPRSRRFHRAIFRRRMAGAPPLSSDDQFGDRRGLRGRDNPQRHRYVLQAARPDRSPQCSKAPRSWCGGSIAQSTYGRSIQAKPSNPRNTLPILGRPDTLDLKASGDRPITSSGGLCGRLGGVSLAR